MSITASAGGGLSDRRTLTLLACFWAAFLVLGTSRALMTGDPDTLIAVPRRLTLTLVGALLSWAIVLVLRSRTIVTTRSKAMWAIGLSLACGVAYAVIVALVFHLMAPITGEGCAFRGTCPEDYLVLNIMEYWVNYAFVFLAWTVLYLWTLAADQALAAERQAGAYREAARVAEIRALRYQINPHFIFNCLNSLSTLVNRGDPREADGMIGELGEFLRAGLYSDPVADIELSDEIDNQRRYLKLEARRFGDRLTVVVDVSAAVSRARVPPLILQPLVENAIKHGVARTSEPVRVSITANCTEDGYFTVRVTNERVAPPPTSPQPPPAGTGGVGLGNVSDRLAARFDGRALLSTRNLPGGFEAAIVIPLTLV